MKTSQCRCLLEPYPMHVCRFPNQIMNIINANVALTRIQKFMEVSPSPSISPPPARGPSFSVSRDG